MQQQEKKNSVEERRTHSPLLYWGTVVTLVLIVVTFVIGPVIGSGYARSISLGKAAGKTIYYDEQFGYAWEQYEQNMASVYGLDLQNMQGYMKSQIRVTAFQGAFFMQAHDCFVQSILDRANIIASQQKAEKIIADSLLAQDSYSQKESLKAYRLLSNKERQDQVEAIQEDYLRTIFRDDLMEIPTVQDFETSFLNEKAFPEKRAIRYLQINNDVLPSSYFVDYGKKDKSHYFTQITAQKIMVSTKTEMDFILSEIEAAPEKFSNIAKDSTNDTDKGEEKTLFFHEILNEFGDSKEKDFKVLLTLKKDQLSPVIKTEYGLLVYKITQDPIEANFEDQIVLDEVKEYILNNDDKAIAGFLADYTAKVYEAVVSTGFDETSKNYNVTISETQPFFINVNGLEQFGNIQNTNDEDVLQFLSTDENFFKNVFSSEIGTLQDILYGESSHLIYEVSQIEKVDAVGEKQNLEALFVDGSTAFQNYIFNHKSYHDNTQKFMDTYSEMFSDSGLNE